MIEKDAPGISSEVLIELRDVLDSLLRQDSSREWHSYANYNVPVLRTFMSVIFARFD
jgi:hypothetical protein